MKAEPARVTLAQLAEEADVSLSTISKVLNGRFDVSRKTREKVEELLEEHGYKRRKASPNAAFLEIVFPELDCAWALEIIRGIEKVARANRASVVITESGTRRGPGADWVEGVIARQPIGVVQVSSDLPPKYRNQLEARSIPFVIIDLTGDPASDVPSVGSANWAGGMVATPPPDRIGPPTHSRYFRT